MQGGGTAKQVARWVALGALFLATLVPIIIFNTYFFPFITGKAFFFRIVIEIAVAAWIVLAFLDKEYRPRFSWVGVIVIAFVVWMFIADVFAVNPLKAFWSNFERMEGWVLLIHLLGFFFAASAVLRVEKKWRAWFLASLAVSLIVCGHAFLQLTGAMPIHQGATRIDSSFGNSAYLAIYLLFNTFIAGWLALTENRLWLKWSLMVVAVIEGILVFFTETRGTVLGLVGALLLAALLTSLTAGKKTRGIALGALVVIVVVVGGLYAGRNSSFVQDNHTLQRVTSISLSDGQTRFTIWGMAWDGFVHSPKTFLLGWGQEGFNYVFNTYYQPSLYNQEPWFDRAHNAFIDWLIAGGLPAFLLYVALFGSAIWMLWKSSELSRAERIALTAALVGYAIHNLFVFDNLYSYVYFFAILALIDSQVGRKIGWMEKAKEMSANAGLTYALPIAAVAAIGIVWWTNIPGMLAAEKLVTAISPGQNTPASNLALFQDLAAHPIFAQQEVREQLVTFASSVAQNSSVSNTDKQQILTLAVTEMQKQITAYPLDAREYLELSYVYRAGGDSADALKTTLAAATLSPKKESIWIEAGATEWDLNDNKDAQADFQKAYDLGGPQFKDLATYAAAGDYAVGDVTDGDQLLMNAYGTTVVDSDILAVAYYRMQMWQRLIALWKLRAAGDNPTAESLFGLASAYYVAGDKADAILTVQRAATLHPEAASSAAAAISQIEGKTTGQ